MRLVVVVEGQTEEAFVRDVLTPHLADWGVFTAATIVGTPKRRGSAALQKGGGDWGKWERDIRRVLGNPRQVGLRVSTLFDLYGLPGGFPGLTEHRGDQDTLRRCKNLEAALASTFDDARLIPYIQRHEFEALALASLESLEALLDAPEDKRGLEALRREIQGKGPEDIDDGQDTAPSKRLGASVPSYRKDRPRTVGSVGHGACSRSQALSTLRLLGDPARGPSGRHPMTDGAAAEDQKPARRQRRAGKQR
jgi:hypothetical protein